MRCGPVQGPSWPPHAPEKGRAAAQPSHHIHTPHPCRNPDPRARGTPSPAAYRATRREAPSLLAKALVLDVPLRPLASPSHSRAMARVRRNAKHSRASVCIAARHGMRSRRCIGSNADKCLVLGSGAWGVHVARCTWCGCRSLISNAVARCRRALVGEARRSPCVHCASPSLNATLPRSFSPLKRFFSMRVTLEFCTRLGFAVSG